jgi:hypothetical protein
MKQGLLLVIAFLFVLIGKSCLYQRANIEESNPDKKDKQAINQQKDSAKEVVGEQDALRIAEEFIAQNGYTDLPPMEDKSKLSYESIEGGSRPDEVLKYRHNMLQPKAYGFIRGGRYEDGWTIVFQYQKDNLTLRSTKEDYDDYIRLYGRAVTMDSRGTNIRVEHEDVKLASADIKLRGTSIHSAMYDAFRRC